VVLSNLQFLGVNFYLVIVSKINCNGDKKIVKATKNDCYYNRYGSSLYRNRAWLSVSQIFVRVLWQSFFFTCTEMFFDAKKVLSRVCFFSLNKNFFSFWKKSCAMKKRFQRQEDLVLSLYQEKKYWLQKLFRWVLCFPWKALLKNLFRNYLLNVRFNTRDNKDYRLTRPQECYYHTILLYYHIQGLH